MPTISALGIGSGLDLNGLLDQLNSAEREKLVPIVDKQRSFEAKLSALGQFRSALESFQDKVDQLSDGTAFQSVTSSSTSEGISVAATRDAVPGQYNIDVTQLAGTYSIATTGLDARDEYLGAGTITITLANNTSVEVDIDGEASTLNDVRDAINKSGIDIQASVVDDGSDAPYRLSIGSVEAGEDAAITNIDFGALAGSLVLDDATEVQGQNAQLTVNGIDIVSQTNQVEGALEGLTLALLEEGEVGVRIDVDNETIRSGVAEFVEAYNRLQTEIDNLTRYEPESGVSGALLGDSTLRSVQVQLRGIFTTGRPEGELVQLSDSGIAMQLDGTLEVDEDILSDIVEEQLAELSAFFAGDDSGDGIAERLSAALQALLDSDGIINSASDSLDRRIDALDQRQERVEASIDRTVERYRKQFSQLDILVGNLNSTSAYVAQQFDILNAQLSQRV
ncbi:hypothetical protein A3709_07635 [Halioglobus sp. HI00S01]|uniref:flagellar filament capping protein FliD n=1 Tax=Halioglobus sp. HI00S01 TaxID=1822214 RepID=UPI0007C354F1|nr:flagellar filament capping protein FliD [Halioglobus sp. HI00S01]KZX54887.1 hypothetical protein A3709_07635 [Halioglobus sp. HI00S01]